MVKKGIYKHYKGNLYEVINIATHSETEEQLVIYKARNDPKLWARPLGMWDDIVEYGGKKAKRFEYAGE